MSVQSPLVSVLIRFYNQEQYIQECVNSVLSQDYQNLQIIIIDDCSSDNSAKIIQQIEKDNPNIVEAINNTENLGQRETFNLAYKSVLGQYFLMLDGDDIYLPGKISTQVKYLNENPDCAACFHDAFVFLGTVENKIYLWSERFEIKRGTSKNIARYGHFPVSHSIMMRRKYMPNIPYDHRLTNSGDWLLLVDLLENSGKTLDYIDQVYSGYRKLVGEISLSSNWERKLKARFQVIKIAKEKYPTLKNELKKYNAELHFVEFLYFFPFRNIFKALKSILLSFILSFPNPLILLRMPLREFIFLVKQRGKIDPYLHTFFIGD